MDRPASVEGLVVADGVDGQSAEELARLGLNVALGSVVLFMIGLLRYLAHPSWLFIWVIGSFRPPITGE